MNQIYYVNDAKITVKGFCPVDVCGIWEAEKLSSFRYLKGDYSIKIEYDNKTVYITDFAGTHCSNQLPRNSTIVLEDNMITSFQQNWRTSGKFYQYPQGFKKKKSFDDFFQAIDDAVALRITDNPTITMSSGHDSGVIVASAHKQKLKFNVLSIKSIENYKVLSERVELVNGEIIDGLREGGGQEFIVNFIPSSTVISGLGADELYATGDDELMAEFYNDVNNLYESRGMTKRFPLSDYTVWKEYFSLGMTPTEEKLKIPFEKYMEAHNFPVHYGEKIPFGIQ